MKIRIYLAIIFSAICYTSLGQNLMKKMEENYLQVRQKPGTNRLLREYLSSVNSAEDTLYAIIYDPMICPRCEAGIPAFYRHLKATGRPEHKMLLITVYKDSIAAAEYNRANNYKSDYFLYDTQKQYSPIFSFNFGNELQGLYVLKLCKSAGRMITGGDCPVWGREFVEQLVAFNTPLDYHVYAGQGGDDEFVARKPSAEYIKNKFKDFAFELPADISISSVIEGPMFEGSRFFYTDLLNNGVMCFTQNMEIGSMQFNGIIKADSTEKRRFIQIPDDHYQFYVQQGMVFYIALGANMLDDEHIGVSYSLPLLKQMESEEMGPHVGFFNEPAIITRNFSSLQTADSIITLDSDIFLAEDFCYEHFNFSMAGEKIIMNCMKNTWPIEFEPEEYMDNEVMNPFCEGFYRTDNPFMAAFDRNTGNLMTRFGKLEECHRQSFTGYYYVYPLSSTLGNEVLYTDGYSGQLYVTSGDNLNCNREHYSLFEVETEKFPHLDTSGFYTYEYVKTYERFFDRCIDRIKLTQDEIYCIVRYGKPGGKGDAQKEEYTFARINRKNGKIKEYRLPRYADFEILSYGLAASTHKEVNPYIFLKKDRKYFLRVFR